MWIIHIKLFLLLLKCFRWEEIFCGDKGRENRHMDNLTDFLWQKKKKNELFIKNNATIMFI